MNHATSSSQFSLSGRSIVLIGSAGLLGRALAPYLTRAGACLHLADRDRAGSETLAKTLAEEVPESRIHVHDVDITSRESLDALIASAEKAGGGIDAMVNLAYPRNPRYGRSIEKVEYADFCENTSLHLGGYFLSAQRFALHFRDRGKGSIILFSSIYGVIAPRFEIYEGCSFTMPVEYAAIKAGILHLVKYFAKWLQGTGVRVNAISPGGILDKQPDLFQKQYKKHCSSKGMLDPADISGTLLYLLSDAGLAVNGQNLVIDDGFTL